MGTHLIAGDLAIREDAEEDIEGVVVTQSASIVREHRWAAGIVVEEIG